MKTVPCSESGRPDAPPPGAAAGACTRYPARGAVIDGKYRVGRLLGRGGMGAVFEATHLLRRAPVALKFIDPAQMAVPGRGARFLNEAVVASKLDCEQVVRVFDVGLLPNGAPFLVMELLDGVDLERRLAAEPGGRFAVPQAVHYVLQILRALQVAHAAGVVHRDLKPSNAFLVEREGEGEGELVKLLDFGISRFVEAGGDDAGRLTETNVALGTPLYVSPEQARDAHQATPRSDLYSVGAMLYELLSGSTPFRGETANDLLFKLFTQEPTPLLGVHPGLPPELAAVVHRALAKSPDARPASAADFARLLAPFAGEPSARVLAQLTRVPSAPGPRVAFDDLASTVDEAALTVRSEPLEPAPSSRGAVVRVGAPRERLASLVPPSSPWRRSLGGVSALVRDARSPSGADQNASVDATPARGEGGHRAERWTLLAVAAAVGMAAIAALTARAPAPSQGAPATPWPGPVDALTPPPAPALFPAPLRSGAPVALTAAVPFSPPPFVSGPPAGASSVVLGAAWPSATAPPTGQLSATAPPTGQPRAKSSGTKLNPYEFGLVR
jgi:serine/threonine protein kinase